MATPKPLRSYLELPGDDLAAYYRSHIEETDAALIPAAAADQESLNRQDLQDILNSSWADYSDAELGLIAMLCNALR
jgi:hypothetical protein